ncbi:MAG: MBL fold metallo-hydrolase [Candidatus Omnitrophota bacterium]
MILETVCVGMMQVNCYILACAEGSPAIIIDPGSEAHKIKRILQRHKLRPGLVVNTHGHYDHIGGDDKFDVVVYAHNKDLPMLGDPRLNLSGLFALSYEVGSEIRALEDKERITLEGIELEVIHVPGHTPGGIALLLKEPKDKILFSGDTLFCRGVGRTDLAGGDQELLMKSIRERLFTLPPDTVIYPGHGPFSTIGEEKKHF